MKNFIIITFLFLATSCSQVDQKPDTSGIYDIRADVELFLATSETAKEEEVIARLIQNKVPNDYLKSLLKKRADSRKGLPGTRFGLEIKVNEKPYSYALHVPESAQQGKTYPLIVLLHGAGGNGDAILPQWINRLQDDFIIACPSYPMGAWWSFNAENLVLDLIDEVQASYSVDHNKVILAGLSNGAIGAYMIGMFHPDKFAGIVPIAGTVTERYMHFLVNLKNTPIYMIQGEFDSFFPIKYSRRVNTILTDMKYPVVYREHSEKGRGHGGHFLPDGEVPALVEWLKKQSRQLNPQEVSMTRELNHMDRINWARLAKGYKLAALQIPGPEREPMKVQDGKISSLFATNKGNNKIEVMGKNLLSYEIYLNTEMVDFNEPVIISTRHIVEQKGKLISGDKKINFYQMVKKDVRVLLSEYKLRRDPNILFDAKIKISLENETQIASNL
jgi:predicted esterase